MNRSLHEEVHGDGQAAGRPMTPNTPMYIGSSTKGMTALAIMQLVEQGLVDLDACRPTTASIPMGPATRLNVTWRDWRASISTVIRAAATNTPTTASSWQA